MTEINSNFKLNLQSMFATVKNNMTNAEAKEVSALEQGGGLDTVSFSKSDKTSKGEKFEDVFEEFDKNVPDSTSTIEEKTLAIEYIDRMLACDDIPDDMKIYWENKKEVIQMEIQRIKNEQQAGSGEKVNDVWEEFQTFINEHFDALDDKLSAEDKQENRLTYYSTYISFCERLLDCSDVTTEQKAEYYRMIGNAYSDIANWE